MKVINSINNNKSPIEVLSLWQWSAETQKALWQWSAETAGVQGLQWSAGTAVECRYCSGVQVLQWSVECRYCSRVQRLQWNAVTAVDRLQERG